MTGYQAQTLHAQHKERTEAGNFLQNSRVQICIASVKLMGARCDVEDRVKRECVTTT